MYRNLKAKRVANSVSQTDMSKIIGTTVSTYCLKENGKRDFTMAEIKMILDYFSCTYEEIFLTNVSSE